MKESFKIIAKYKWFLIAWFAINIIQSYFTNLHYDEAYYWIYSKILAWGYFDHPPMVAIISRIGDTISHSTLGLRIIPIIMGVIVLIGILRLTENKKKNNINIFLYIISFPLITSHIAGFLILPDASLCFFFILFLFSYKNYLKEDSTKNTLILSIFIAGMIYSKYHALLIIALTILSNIKLLLKKSFWLATLFSLLLLTPHFIWQFQHDFPSILYHTNTRTSGFNFNNFIEYIYSQIILAGPLSGLLIIFLGLTFKPKDIFEKTLKYIAFGFYLFFLLYCFRSRIEAHWTSISTITLIIISYKQLNNTKKIKKIIPYLLYPSIILILTGRILLAGNYLEDKLSFKSNFMDMEEWANELDSISEGTPILFTNKYHDLSIYSFAKNKWIPGAPSYYSRFSQIDLHKIDSIYDGKKVFALSYGKEVQWVSKNKIKHRGSFIENYYSYTGITIDELDIIKKDSLFYLSFKLFNNNNKKRLFLKDSAQRLKLHYTINNDKYKSYFHDMSKRDYILPFEKITFNLPIKDVYSEKINIDITLTSNSLRVFHTKRKISFIQ